jgi:hypothetical protein
MVLCGSLNRDGLRLDIQWNDKSRSQIAKMLMVAHDLASNQAALC